MGVNLKDAEEVKQYLENLHTEYQFGCYSEKNPEACHLLSDYMEAVQQKFTEAAGLYKTTCDKYDYAKSCGKYGGLRAAGRGIEKNPKDGYAYLKKGCDLKDPKACFMAGSLLLSGEDVGLDRPTRLKEAIQFLTRGCDDYNIDNACAYLAGIYLGSLKEEVTPDLKKGFHYSLKSCDLGNPYACANVAKMHKNGDGTEQNATLAATFQKRAEALYRELVLPQSQLKFHQGA